MNLRFLKLIAWFGAVVLALVVVFVLLYSFTPLVDRAILGLMNVAVDHNIHIKYEHLEGNLLGTVRFRNVSVAFNGDTIRCKTVVLKYSSLDLLKNKISIHSLVLDDPIVMIHAAADTSEKNETAAQFTSEDSLAAKIDLSAFPNLTIRELLIKDATVTIDDGNKSNRFTGISLLCNAAINSGGADIGLRYLKGRWDERDLDLRHLSFQLRGNEKRLTLNQLQLSLEDAQLTAHGEVELQPHFRFLIFADTSEVSVSLLNKIIPGIPFKYGSLEFSGDFIGNPTDFRGKMFFSGTADTLQLRRFACAYQYHNKTLELNNLRILTNFGNISGFARVAPEGNNRISLNFSNVNLKKSPLGAEQSDLNGWIRLNFNTWNFNSLSGEGKAQLTAIKFGKIRADTLYMNLGVKDGNWDVRKGSRLVVQEASQFFVEGTMNRQQVLDLHLYTDHNNLDTLDSSLGLGLIGGNGSLNVDLTGPLANPTVSGSFLLDSLVVQNSRAYGVEGKFELRSMIEERTGYFKLDLSSALVSGILVTDGVIALRIRHDTVQMDSISFYNNDNYFTLAGAVERKGNLFDVKLNKMELRYENYLIFAPETLEAVYQGDSLQIENFVLQAPEQGEVEARGYLNFKGNSGLAIYLKNIRLLAFNQFINWQYNVGGLMEVSTEISGKLDSLILDSFVDVHAIALDADTLGNLKANLTYDNHVLKIGDFNFQHSDNSYFSLKGEMALPKKKDQQGKFIFDDSDQLALDCEFKGIRISDYPFFKKYNFPVQGTFDGSIKLEGTAKNPRGTYLLSGNRVIYQDYSVRSFRLDGRILPSRLTLDLGEINLLNSDIKVNGYTFLHLDLNNPDEIFSDKRFGLFVKMQEDTVNFISLLTPEVDELTGKIDFTARLGGTWDYPSLIEAEADISNGKLYLTKVENPVTNIEFEASLKNNKLEILTGTARMAGESENRNIFQKFTAFIFSPFRKLLFPTRKQGQIAISGDVDLSRLQRPKVNLHVKTNRAYVNYFLENTQLVVSTNNLHISGRDTITVQGDVTVNKGQVNLDLKESEKNLLLSPAVRETPPYLAYMLNVSIPGNFYVRSEATFNSFEMLLNGDLQIIQEPRGLLEASGNLEVPKGKYYQFEEFDISNGQVSFTNPKELPQLDINAEKRKYGYLFQLHVQGPLNNPVKDIRIYDLDTQQDITYLYPETKDQISLLLFGVTFKDLGSSVVLEKGQEMLNQALVSQIEREARRFIGLDEIRMEGQQNILDFSNRRLNQDLGESTLSLGKYLSPRLYLEYTTQLSSAGLPGLGNIPTPRLAWEAGNQIYLEYRINKNWSISTYYEKREYDKIKFDINWRLNF